MRAAPTEKRRGRGRERPQPLTSDRGTMALVRKALGLSQAEVAAALGHGEQAIVSRYESRAPSALVRYAAALGARVELAFVLQDGRRVLIEPEPE